ncbi:MAG TPA: nuclear transport factor 2 family protein [Acidimicrobiales bacterium]|jgi:ketosteroid isomerase-like protein
MSTTRSAVERYLSALNEHDADAVAACVTADFVNEHTSARGTSRAGRDAYRAALPVFLDRFADLHYAAEDLLVDGDRAAVAYRMTCQWRDDDGRSHPVSLRGMFRFRVVDGLIAHRVDYWDGSDFERQVLR